MKGYDFNTIETQKSMPCSDEYTYHATFFEGRAWVTIWKERKIITEQNWEVGNGVETYEMIAESSQADEEDPNMEKVYREWFEAEVDEYICSAEMWDDIEDGEKKEAEGWRW